MTGVGWTVLIPLDACHSVVTRHNLLCGLGGLAWAGPHGRKDFWWSETTTAGEGTTATPDRAAREWILPGCEQGTRQSGRV